MVGQPGTLPLAVGWALKVVMPCAGITAKRKSLNRRKNGTEGLGDALEHLTKQITLTQDFLKKCSAGTAASEGRIIYDKLVDCAAAGTEVSKAFWERALKAVAFEDRIYFRIGILVL